MDSFLISYLKSGKAWVLVGSGPSIESGYPSWEKLANVARETVCSEGITDHISRLEAALKRSDLPQVFEEAKSSLGWTSSYSGIESKARFILPRGDI